MTLFDLLAIVAILLSVLAGLSNGAVRELVGLFAFGLAVGGALLLLPISRPIARATVHPTWAASAVAVVVAFLLIYIGLQVGGRFLTARLRASGGLGSLDRVAGGAIGLLRAGLLLGAFYLFYRAATPVGMRPQWIERAALLPVAQAAGDALQSLTPKGMTAAGKLGPALKNAMASPDPGAGAKLGAGQPNATDLSDQPAAVSRGKAPYNGSTAKPRARHKSLDVVMDRAR